MAVNYLTSVPKLTGRENYDDWSFAVENVFVLEGLTKCLDGTEEDSTVKAKAKAKLVLTLDPPLFVHVKGAETAKEVWTRLKQLYDDSGFTRKIGLLRNLISLRLENCESMESYVNQLVETSQKLRRTGFNIDEEWIGSLLLAGLPERFAPMIMAVEHSGIAITTDAIKTKLLDMQVDGASGVSGEAFAVNKGHSSKQYGKKSKGGSSNGNRRNQDSGCSGTSAGDKFRNSNSKQEKHDVICFKCKQSGHYMSNCPNKKQAYALSAVFVNGQFESNDWYLDSGASMHLTARNEWLVNQREPDLTEIICANKARLPVKCTGDVELETVVGRDSGTSSLRVILKDVQFIPGLTTNLLSVGQLINNGNRVEFNSKGCKIYNVDNVLVGTADLVGNVFKLNLNTSMALLVSPVNTAELWHRRLGHINAEYLNKMPELVDGLVFSGKSDIQKQNCEVCCEAKQTRLPFPKKGSRAESFLQVVHSDVCGPMDKWSVGGSKYFLTFIDDYSRMCHLYFLKTKDEVLQKFKEYKCLVEKQKNSSIKVLRTDNGGEYCNKEFSDFLRKNGIIHQKTNSYTPEQNGMAERLNRTIVEKAKCLLFDQDLGKSFWAEACNTACYILNRCVTSGVSKTPFELWYNKKPNIGHIRVFGSPTMVHIPKEKRKKWDKKATKHILVGYDDNTKGYRLYNPVTKKVINSRDVTVMESPRNIRYTIETKARECDSVGEELTVSSESPEDSFSDLTEEADGEDVDYVPETSPNLDLDQPRRSQRPPKPKVDNDFVSYACEGVSTTEGDPVSVQEALGRPDGDSWRNAIEEELDSFEKNNAWELVTTEKDSTVVDCKWVFKKKVNSAGEVKYRARLVAKGFTQRYGIDYNETFSPVVRYSTLRLLFALAVKYNLDIRHLDIKTAFLNGYLNETVFMKIPEGYKGSYLDGKVLKLKRAVYGLKQSAKCWNDRINTVLLELGYQKSKYEPCVYIKRNDSIYTIVTLYVDDFFIFSNDVQETEFLKAELDSRFSIKDLGSIKECLGMKVDFDKDKGILTLSQTSYIDQLLKQFNMSECKVAKTPIEPKLKLEPDDQNKEKLPFKNLIGSLMYLAVLTRPDIAFSVSYLSQFNNSYSEHHWKCAKHILRYLKGTKHYGLRFSRDNTDFVGYADADWGNNLHDRKSYTGYVFKFQGSLISWESRKQRTVALSSTEAEYMAISEAAKESIYLKNLMCELTGNDPYILIYNDNQGAINLSANHTCHKRSKHIDIRHHFIRQVVSENKVNLKYLPTNDMPADMLTKSLSTEKHSHFLKVLGLKM